MDTGVGYKHRLKGNQRELILERLCGHPSEFELEFQVLNWIFLMNAFMGVVLAVQNLWLGMPASAALTVLVVAFISSSGYYVVRVRKNFSNAIAPLLYIFSIISLGSTWFDHNGLMGSIPYFFLVPIFGGVVIMRGKTRTAILSLTIVSLFVLIALDKIIPHSVKPYASDHVQWVDTLAGVIYAIVYGLGYILILVHNLNRRREIADQLLRNILPESIVERLKYRPDEIVADMHKSVTVLFADLVDFTPMSAKMSPIDLINLLNKVFTLFDQVAEKHGLEKIKTIGDCYMVACGVPLERSDHATRVVQFALEMRERIARSDFDGKQLRFRFGIDSGSLVAGVIGQDKFAYDLWGSTVNTASRMESNGQADAIQITRATYELVKDQFTCTAQGKIPVKGVGELDVWHVEGP